MNDHVRITLYVFLGAVNLFGPTLHPRVLGQQKQETYRIVRRLPVEQNEPVTITMVAVKGQTIATNEKFLADDDWLDGLTITLKNSSEKKILLASVQLQFPSSDASKGTIAVDDVSYGDVTLLERQGKPHEKSETLNPGQSVDLHVSADDFDRISRLVASNGNKGSIDVVALRIGRIIFADDTMWYAGSYLQRAQSALGPWTKFEVK